MNKIMSFSDLYGKINLASIFLSENNYLQTSWKPIPGDWKINKDYNVKKGSRI